MAKSGTAAVRWVGLLIVGGLIGYWIGHAGASRPSDAAGAAAATSVARGAQLVTLGGCDDCHTPKRADGSPDMTHRMAGYESSQGVPAGSPGAIAINMHLTAWRGPWGLSLSRNITPDPETGIGNWTFEQFKHTLRSGVDPSGKALLPPMPAAALASLPDSDLEAIYNYLRTVPAIHNAVTGP